MTLMTHYPTAVMASQAADPAVDLTDSSRTAALHTLYRSVRHGVTPARTVASNAGSHAGFAQFVSLVFCHQLRFAPAAWDAPKEPTP